MRTLLLTLLLAFGFNVQAQSLWFEVGLGYIETAPEVYAAGPKVGLRGSVPLSAEAFGPEAFVALAIRGGLVMDAGVWAAFAPGGSDLFGLQSYAGAGLSYTQGELGLAFALALAYELERDLAVSLAYTHRPVFSPRFAQAFDIALGLKLSLD
ncbi:MAG: hypothetical protein M3498_03000 [Deinococcota bacterium]|jgi:hypothetical protein|nr:hypothetical protein [Deinococcota bacterium]